MATPFRRAVSASGRGGGRGALDDLYAFYERTARMWANVFRDLDVAERRGEHS
jgi:hypothetical protein